MVLFHPNRASRSCNAGWLAAVLPPYIVTRLLSGDGTARLHLIFRLSGLGNLRNVEKAEFSRVHSFDNLRTSRFQMFADWPFMRLKFLGTGGYHPSERRHTACLMLPEAGVVLDAGTGFFRVQASCQTATLDVFLTHAHLDHICGLTYLMVPLLRGDVQNVRVYGSPSTLQSVRTHLFSHTLFPVEPPYEWCELRAEQAVALADGGSLRWTDLQHPGGAVGYRIDWPGRSLAYITDTTAPGYYIEFIRGVDLLIHECYFPDAMSDWAGQTGHSSATAVAQMAKDAQAGRLILVHTDPQSCEDDPVGLASMRAVFAETEIAEDLQDIDF